MTKVNCVKCGREFAVDDDIYVTSHVNVIVNLEGNWGYHRIDDIEHHCQDCLRSDQEDNVLFLIQKDDVRSLSQFPKEGLNDSQWHRIKKGIHSGLGEAQWDVMETALCCLDPEDSEDDDSSSEHNSETMVVMFEDGITITMTINEMKKTLKGWTMEGLQSGIRLMDKYKDNDELSIQREMVQLEFERRTEGKLYVKCVNCGKTQKFKDAYDHNFCTPKCSKETIDNLNAQRSDCGRRGGMP